MADVVAMCYGWCYNHMLIVMAGVNATRLNVMKNTLGSQQEPLQRGLKNI